MLPYFEGDFWVSEGELALKLFIKDDIKKREEEAEQKILDAGGRRMGRARKKRKTKHYAEEKISAIMLSDSKNLVSSTTASAAVTTTTMAATTTTTAATTTTTTATTVPTNASVGGKNEKHEKSNKNVGANGSVAKEDDDDEEKFEKLPLEQREKETSRLMRKLATMMEVMKPDFLVCKLKHTCSRCHKYILNGTRYKCERSESVGHPFNLCQACYDIENAKTGLNKTLHEVHCERGREDAAYNLGGGGTSGFKRLLSIDREEMSKNRSKNASSPSKKESSGSSSSSSSKKKTTSRSSPSKASAKTTTSSSSSSSSSSVRSSRHSSRSNGTATTTTTTTSSRRSSRRGASAKTEDVPSLEDVLRRNKLKNSKKKGEKYGDEKEEQDKEDKPPVLLPPTKVSSKKAAILDKVKANEQRRSRALALKKANYERLIEVMAWDDEKHVLTTAKESTVDDTKDPDDKLDCPILNSRLALLGVCQGNRYQFDQKRRAKHSTMMLLYHLHNPKVPLYVHTCNECQKDILGSCRFHCSVCPDFDLCARCYRDVHHIHRLKRIEVDVSGTADEETNKEERKKRSLALFFGFIS